MILEVYHLLIWTEIGTVTDKQWEEFGKHFDACRCNEKPSKLDKACEVMWWLGWFNLFIAGCILAF